MRGLQTATWLYNHSLGSPPLSGSWVSLKDVEAQPVTWMQWHWGELNRCPHFLGSKAMRGAVIMPLCE